MQRSLAANVAGKKRRRGSARVWFDVTQLCELGGQADEMDYHCKKANELRSKLGDVAGWQLSSTTRENGHPDAYFRSPDGLTYKSLKSVRPQEMAKM
jgi:hypothetical protein